MWAFSSKKKDADKILPFLSRTQKKQKKKINQTLTALNREKHQQQQYFVLFIKPVTLILIFIL